MVCASTMQRVVVGLSGKSEGFVGGRLAIQMWVACVDGVTRRGGAGEAWWLVEGVGCEGAWSGDGSRVLGAAMAARCSYVCRTTACCFGWKRRSRGWDFWLPVRLERARSNGARERETAAMITAAKPAAPLLMHRLRTTCVVPSDGYMPTNGTVPDPREPVVPTATPPTCSCT